MKNKIDSCEERARSMTVIISNQDRENIEKDTHLKQTL